MMQRNVIRTLTPEEMQLLQPELQAIAAGEAAKDALGRYLQLIAGCTNATYDAGTGELFTQAAREPPPADGRAEVLAAMNGGGMGPHGVARDARVVGDEGEVGA